MFRWGMVLVAAVVLVGCGSDSDTASVETCDELEDLVVEFAQDFIDMLEAADVTLEEFLISDGSGFDDEVQEEFELRGDALETRWAEIGCSGAISDVMEQRVPEFRALGSSAPTELVISVLLTAPPGTDPEVVDVAADVVRSRLGERLSGLGDAGYVEASRVGLDELLVRVSVDTGLTAADVIDVVSVRGDVSFRPVYDVGSRSPALTNPDDSHPPNVDPDTGLSRPDHPNTEIAYLPGDDGTAVYVVGPAFLTTTDLAGGTAQFAQQGNNSGQWVVVPEFTSEGGEKFREGTGYLASFSVGSPKRQVAIVIDGVVIAAPALAPDVDPDLGLDPEAVVITIGSDVNAQQEAENLAAFLRYGALPVMFEIKVTEPTD